MSEFEEQWTNKEKKEISDIAYFKWIDAGCPDGMDQFFWNQAVKEKLDERDSFEIIEVNLTKPKPAKKDIIVISIYDHDFFG